MKPYTRPTFRRPNESAVRRTVGGTEILDEPAFKAEVMRQQLQWVFEAAGREWSSEA